MAGFPTSEKWARVNPQHPEPWGICDRCGFLYNFNDLQYQYQWSGLHLQNTYFLVCSDCLDFPNPQAKTIILPQDPKPVLNARPPQWIAQQGPPQPPFDPNAQTVD